MKLLFLVAIHHIFKHIICITDDKALMKFWDLEVSPQITCIKSGRGGRRDPKAKDLLRETKQASVRTEGREDRKISEK